MASSSSGGGAPPPPRAAGVSAKQTTDPVLRNTLRYTISAREYAVLHRYILSRSRSLKKRMPTVETVTHIMNGPGDFPTSANKGHAAEMSVRDVGSTSAGAGAGAGAMVGADDYNARAVRHSLRVFAATATGMKLYALVAEKLMGAKRE